ncbi:MAG: Polyribonucleotide nucleotidyltransferase [Chlamydiales bacterium]|nr:Polyribonucleotide nucleotidyltransferase [Chlamydiales bacterium]MCH9634931.1 Polyribonucleotide nucleotidyltransferase [Chlamydiales bacterium]MCH9703535.1 polyribonucleotide nucleotidyltransferase [Chlamydiota bacterium]
MERKIKKVRISDDKELEFETGKIARQANGAVLVKQGETILFASACGAKEASEDVDFLPLRVDYQEKFSSTGKSLGGFIKREGRPSEREILVSRLIDRPLRPFFTDGYYKETQILTYVWSYDGINKPDALAITAASAALVISDIPLIKPVAGVRVGRIDGKFVINPSGDEMEKSDLDLMLAGTEDAILMIEGFCDFLSEDEVLAAIEAGHSAIKAICHALLEWQKEVGKEKNMEGLRLLSKDLLAEIEKLVGKDLAKAVRIQGKSERDEATSACALRVNEHFAESEEFSAVDVKMAFKKVNAKLMRRMILDEGVRADGRKVDDVRFIDVEAGLLPRTHGSALFTRGETQSVAVCTLGGESMGQRYETLDEDNIRRFYLQYFFPPFSVGEVGRVGPAGRREVGHGKLAERALAAAAPSLADFPYTIRLESNITESNGSSSMASVCGGCLAMMDAGVPIKRPVAGIAMGLILEDKEVAILSDILGLEDALGDMDFKVTGDAEGITAFQMDIKVEGITLDIMRNALNQAKAGRVNILEKMLQSLPHSRDEMSIYAPRIETMQVAQNKIATIIGPGGKQIRAIIEETGVQIDINDDGLVSIASSDPQSMTRAKQIIEGLTGEVEVGKIYEGKVTSVVQFGVFVEILPGKEGLCHISELSPKRVNDIFAYIEKGAEIKVKVLDINERGQLKLSRKVLMSEEAEAEAK